MKTQLAILAMVLFAATSCTKKHGHTHCTDEDQSTWQDQEAFQQNLVEQGYRINEFKVTKGNCYEIYGWDKEQNKVEIYFNPIDGSIVKQKSQ
ncbi:MAG: PepSY domain-containing protein [Bdellovibrionaceae bacterium]|nr:PepSY domain-containing protein [Pseudobdellovibrionaceae bacterium]